MCGRYHFHGAFTAGLGASEAVLPQAGDYAFWMFVAALANLPAQSMNCAARAESSVKISSIAVVTGAALNVVLDCLMLYWGFAMGVEGLPLPQQSHSLSHFLSWDGSTYPDVPSLK